MYVHVYQLYHDSKDYSTNESNNLQSVIQDLEKIKTACHFVIA